MKKIIVILFLAVIGVNSSFAQNAKKTTTPPANTNSQKTTSSQPKSDNYYRPTVKEMLDVHNMGKGKGTGKTNPKAQGTLKN